MNANQLIKTVVIFTLTLVFNTSYSQTTHTVNNNTGTTADFTDLQTAIDATANGDIIYVQQSATSYGDITINKALTIIGRSHSDASYTSEIGTLYLDAGASNTTIKGLKINGIYDGSSTAESINNIVISDNKIDVFTLGSSHFFNNVLMQGNYINSQFTIYTNTANVLISNNIIGAQYIESFMVDTLLLSNNIFSSYTGVYFYNYTPDLMNISNCIFVSNYASPSTINFYNNSGTYQVDNCLTYNYDTNGTYDIVPDGSATINVNMQQNTDPLFTNINLPLYSSTIDPNDDLTLQTGSPVSDDGLYQGYNFKMFGTPTTYPSLKVTSYSSTVPKNGNLTVTIEAKTN
ncbi:MAG: hypothetical protein KDD26_00070 [Winogradskyella sp.]|nr:hypothetical protein [Winogradskyella sp.]